MPLQENHGTRERGQTPEKGLNSFDPNFPTVLLRAFGNFLRNPNITNAFENEFLGIQIRDNNGKHIKGDAIRGRRGDLQNVFLTPADLFKNWMGKLSGDNDKAKRTNITVKEIKYGVSIRLTDTGDFKTTTDTGEQVVQRLGIKIRTDRPTPIITKANGIQAKVQPLLNVEFETTTITGSEQDEKNRKYINHPFIRLSLENVINPSEPMIKLPTIGSEEYWSFLYTLENTPSLRVRGDIIIPGPVGTKEDESQIPIFSDTIFDMQVFEKLLLDCYNLVKLVQNAPKEEPTLPS